MKPVDVIFLDAGGTLIYPEPGVGEAYAREGRRYGVDADPDALAAAFRDSFRARKLRGPQTREWWREVVRETFGGFGEPTDLDRLFSDLYEHFASAAAWRPFPDARETLETLRRRGYATGLISNWDDRLPGILEGLGLLAALDPVVISHRVGADKPSRVLYETALAEAGVSAERAVMVGDDRELDVRGARDAGLAAIHFVPGAESQDGRIGRLADLLRLFP